MLAQINQREFTLQHCTIFAWQIFETYVRIKSIK
jgi:hypothetical protein